MPKKQAPAPKKVPLPNETLEKYTLEGIDLRQTYNGQDHNKNELFWNKYEHFLWKVKQK